MITIIVHYFVNQKRNTKRINKCIRSEHTNEESMNYFNMIIYGFSPLTANLTFLEKRLRYFIVKWLKK